MASDRVAMPTDHNPTTAAAPAPRSAYTRSARTNSLVPPPGLNPRSSEGRRWRDLCHYYGQRLGPQCLADEAIRALLLNLIDLTLELERIRDLPPAQQPRAETRLHLQQEQRTLLAQLGLSAATRSDAQPARSDPPDPDPPDPLDYAREYGGEP
jgi:hypothetical protein